MFPNCFPVFVFSKQCSRDYYPGISHCSVEHALGLPLEISIDISIRATETQLVSSHNNPVNACNTMYVRWTDHTLNLAIDSI